MMDSTSSSSVGTPAPSQAVQALQHPVLRRWAEQIRDAAERKQALQVRGGGSKHFLFDTAPGELLDTREYSGIVSHEPTELVVTVRAGTPLAELERTLAAAGQYLPFEPPHFAQAGNAQAVSAHAVATVGGMVAAGLSGPARASVGAVRDFVLGAELFNGRGEHLVFGGQVMKNVAGYDVSRLLAGSMGTLCVLTEVSLKVLPVAPAEAILRFTLGQAEALQQMARWRALPLPLNASCWVQDSTAPGAPNHLYVRLRGAVAAVQSASQRMLQDAPGERLDTAATAPDWTACREQTLPFFDGSQRPGLALWRLSVAPNTPALDDVAAHAMGIPGGVAGATLVEWHGGLRWLWAPVGAGDALRAWARHAGGHATLFRCPDGVAVPTAQRYTLPEPTVLAIQQRLKEQFDPAGILNPGRWGYGL